MRLVTAMAGRRRGVATAIALAAIMTAGLVLEAAHAESRSSTTINGKTITVIGGSSQSVSTTGLGTVVMLDGRRIVISGGTIEVDDSVHEVGDFTRLEIRAHGGGFDIFVDGQLID